MKKALSLTKISDREGLRLLRNRAQTFRIGHMHLRPDEECGWHSTEKFEEILVILNGEGKIQSEDMGIAVERNSIVHIPPRTSHNVIAGKKSLEYLYIVVPVEVGIEDIDWIKICNDARRAKIGLKNEDEWKARDPWRELAELYDRWCEATDYPGKLIDKVSSFLKSDDAVLEIGPGTGAFTVSLAEKVRTLVAIEPSFAMRGILTRKIKTAGIKNVTVLPCRLEELKIDEKFDIVFAAFSLGVRDFKEAILKMTKFSRRYCILIDGERDSKDGVRNADDMLRELIGMEKIPYVSYLVRVNALWQMGIRANVEIVNKRSDVPWELYIDNRRKRYSQLCNWNQDIERKLLDLLKNNGFLVLKNGEYYIVSSGIYALLSWDVGS